MSRSAPIPQSIVPLDEIFNPRHRSPSSGFTVNFTRCAGALRSGFSSHPVSPGLMHRQLAFSHRHNMPSTAHHLGPTLPQQNLSKTKPGWICRLSQLATLKPFHQTADAFNRVPFRECSPWTLLSAGSLESLEGGSSVAL